MGLKNAITESSDSQPVTVVTKEHQLQLRLFARLDAFKGTPPESAIFRELLKASRIPATAIRVAWIIYGRRNKAGIINIGVKTLAKDGGVSEKTIRRALGALHKAFVVSHSRASMGKAFVYRINCGGMDWPMVMERAKHDRAELGMPATDPDPTVAGADSVTALSTLGCGHFDRTSADILTAHRAKVGLKSPTTSAREGGAAAAPPAVPPEAPGRPAAPSRFGRNGPASERQRDYARKLGVRLPEDATNDSANEVIQSAVERKGQGCLATERGSNSKLKANSRLAAKAQANRTQDGYNGTHKLAACRSEACKGTERNFKRVELGSTVYWQCPNCEVLHAV